MAGEAKTASLASATKNILEFIMDRMNLSVVNLMLMGSSRSGVMLKPGCFVSVVFIALPLLFEEL